MAELQARYPPRGEYRYDAETLEARGRERAKEIANLPLRAERMKDVLEVGCMDGMTSRALQQMGWTLSAIDQTPSFDQRAARSGVRFFQTDASRLGFRENSFDIAFSYNAFEHFHDPDAVLTEITRVVRPGGYVFVSFGPLYMSPWGLHAYHSIRVPYCQFLFPKEVMQAYVKAHGLNEIKFTELNGWPATAFRDLWRRHSSSLKTVTYSEGYDQEHVDIIESFPTCFKSKTSHFEELIVSSIAALFMKRE